MKKPNLAVLGATGVVGREILSILVENDVPFENIKFLASSKSAGKKIEFKGKEYTIEEATPDSFEGVNIVLASASNALIIGFNIRPNNKIIEYAKEKGVDISIISESYKI